MKFSGFIKSALSSLFTTVDDTTEDMNSCLPEIPRSEYTPTKRELEREAAEYARRELRCPHKKRFYASLAKGKQSAHQVAKSMFLSFVERRPKVQIG